MTIGSSKPSAGRTGSEGMLSFGTACYGRPSASLGLALRKGTTLRKQIMQHTSDASILSPPWLEVASLAHVELTSEDPAYPIDAALLPRTPAGWRAAQPGEQVIWLVFDRPQSLHHLRLVFAEAQQVRTQEFVVRWSADGGQSYREVVRQQYIFSPPGTVHEVEDYQVRLDDVTHVELRIVPDIQGGDACATLQEMRLR
jgi:hypothetical protein